MSLSTQRLMLPQALSRDCHVQVLLAADSREQVLTITADLSQLKVVPLLQGILFGR